MESLLNTPKFDGNNYTSWKYRVLSILESKELDSYLTTDSPEAPEAKLLFKKKDSQTRGIITCLMNDTQVSLILTCKTAKEIWQTLEARYEGDKKRMMIEAKKDVNRIRMYKDEDWQHYLLRAERLLTQARVLGADIPEEEFISVLIQGLPPKYNLIALQFDIIQNPTINDVHRLFKLHQERNGLQEKCENSKAFQVYDKKFNRNYEKGGGQI